MELLKPPTRITSDIIVYNWAEASICPPPLQVLLIERKYPPFKGKLALPGGHINLYETAIQAAKRELEEETGIVADINDLRFLFYRDEPKRDSRGHYIDFVFDYLCDERKHTIMAADDAASCRFHFFADLKDAEMAFDHAEVLGKWHEQLKIGVISRG